MADKDIFCGHYNGTKYMVVGILHSCSAAVSFFSSLLVIGMIILFRKHRFFSQRLILYLSVAALLYSLATASAKSDYITTNYKTEKYCEWIAFVSQYTQWCLLLAVCIITFDILLKISFNRLTQFLEVPYIIVIFIFPAVFNWIPFYWHLYGISGDWCWIKTFYFDDSGNCVKSTKSVIIQFSLWYGPLFILLCAILISYIFIILLLRRQRRQMSIYNPDQIHLLRTMRNEIYTIIWYPIVYLIINLFPLANRITYVIGDDHPVFVLWLLHALISPLQGGFMALVYAIDPETRQKLNRHSIYGAFVQFFHCEKDEHEVEEYSAVIGQAKASITDPTRRPLLGKSGSKYGAQPS